NIAKEMHVGHLRSTILGDCICRVLAFLGHEVIRQNHIGDWGALGKVILGLWHMCMDEMRHGNGQYYAKEIKDLKACAGDTGRMQTLCQSICQRHTNDWEDDCGDRPDGRRGDGKKYFTLFLDKLESRPRGDLWDRITILYQYVNLLEESVGPFHLRIPIRKKKTSIQAGTSVFEYPLVPYESLSRHTTAMLQKIDADNEQEKKAGELITSISLEYCETIYDLLNVKITDKHFDYKVVRGESFYRRMLPGVVKRLVKAGLAIESDGAICVFPEGFKNKEGDPLPLIIEKSDGAHLYATTDLAAVRYRANKLKAQRIVYVTDARQALHFAMFFAVAKNPKAKWIGQDVELVHVTFGSVLGEDGSPLKTRSGENVKLKELLDEAVERARAVVEQKNPDLKDSEKDRIATAVGIGAVKYADYSNNRTSDYVFSFERMLSLEGNTAPYLQYAYARIKSIERKASQKDVDVEAELSGLDNVALGAPEELDLGKFLCRYGDAVEAAAADYRPNYLTAYLYELAQKFSAFYTNCPVLGAEPKDRAARLLLCELTARTIRHGLSDLLGIDVIERM
ncbi:MAG TPA: arginine--tRNA ligase, partial [Phycisphaerales bacterium]|nr:arginine--tRNA ligase [Phycisphaerales bacterium]